MEVEAGVKETQRLPENYIDVEGAWKIPKLILRRPEETKDVTERAELEKKLQRQWAQHQARLATEPRTEHLYDRPTVNFYPKDWQEGEEENYYLVEKKSIGGGMGNVHKAWDNHLADVIAIKVMQPSKSPRPEESEPSTMGEMSEMSDQTNIQQLEAKTIARLRHPGIPFVLNYQEVEITDKNSPYCGQKIKIMAEEYMDPAIAPTLREVFKRKSFKIQEIITIIKELAKTIDFMDQKGLHHGDLTPANIFLHPDHVKIADFGLSSWTVSWKGERRGTAGYMAPEIVQGKGLTLQSEVFSLATLAHLMLTRQLPFAGIDAEEIMSKILHAKPIPPSQLISKELAKKLKRGGRDALDMVFAKAFQKKPKKRYRTTTAFAKDLESVLRTLLS